MAIYYIDLVNGSDAAAGTSWATAWKTVTSGSTAARIAPGDTIRMAKSPDKISLGNGTWTSVTSNTQPGTTSTITGATNATPISITVASHGWSTGDMVSIEGVGGNTAALGNWIITNTGTNTFTLDGSVGNGAYTSGGTAQKINFRAVNLASNTQTKIVSDCNIAYTAANSATSTTTSTCKSGGLAIQITSPAAAAANTKYAFQALPASTDFSAFTHITLWYWTTTTVTNATAWRVCLCSDTLGATIVDSFPLPITGTTSQWNSLVIAKTGGGALGATIQSVAIYSGATQLNSSTIILDNINACTATGLNLQSVISPVSSNTDLYDNYSIASITGTILGIDQDYNQTNNNAAGVRGYSGTVTGSTTTYYRQALDYATLNGLGYTTISGAMFGSTEAGTVSAITTWSGGWNTSTTTQDGITLTYCTAGSVGWSPLDYNKIEWMGILRGARAYGQNTSQARTYSGFTIENCFGTSATVGYFGTGISVLAGATYPNKITNFGLNNIGTPAINAAAQVLYFNTVKAQNCCAVLAASFLGGVINNSLSASSTYTNIEISNSGLAAFYQISGGASFYNITVRLCAGFVIAGSSTAYYNTVTTSNNTNIFVSSSQGPLNGGNQLIQDITYNEATPFNNGIYSAGNFMMSGLNGTNSSFLGYVYQGVFSRETSITHSGASSWKVNVLTTARDAGYPVPLNFGQIYLKANVSTTISAWMYLTSANLGANLTLVGYQIAGVTTDQVATANSATVNAWQQVSMTFTPTSDGVVTLEANVWLTTGTNQSVYIDDISVPIGINTSPMEQPYFGTPWVQNAVAPSVAYGAVGL